MRSLSRALDYVAGIGAVIGGVLGVFMMFAVSVEVAYRKIFIQSTRWVNDFAEASLMFMCFFGIAWVLRQDKHVRIDAFTRLLPPRLKMYFDVVTRVIALLAVALITVLGVTETLNDITSSRMMVKSTLYPRWWASIAIPIGCFLMTIALAVQLWELMGRLRRGEFGAQAAGEEKTAS